MLTELSSVKTRLGITPADVSNDALLNQLIAGVSARFDTFTGRRLERTVGFLQEFGTTDRELIPICSPTESVSKWEAKATESEGWTEITDIDYIIRHGCVISLLSQPSALNPQLLRVTYTGGYVVPPGVPAPGQTALPKDLEGAAIEQVAFLFQRRSGIGLYRIGPNTTEYVQVKDLDLTPAVRAVLKHFVRFQ